MVPDYVALPGDFADNIRTLTNIAADDEKCCEDVVPGENVEQA